MSLANDNYYGYAKWVLVTRKVTWLERACASLCWSTIRVYYLEEPYGHLMLEEAAGATSRTKVRGNLFSFAMAWEDVYRCCQEAEQLGSHERQGAAALSGLSQESGCTGILLLRTEETLASLVRVCVRGGNKDLAHHLDGVTMRPSVVLELIKILRSSGYPG